MQCDIVKNCTWQGTVGTLEEHAAKCQFTLLPCPKECKDDSDETKYFMKKDLDDHLEKYCPNRDYKCQYCGEKGTYADITQIHNAVCKEKTTSCPNSECTETIKCHRIREHVDEECPYTVTHCKYESIGCNKKTLRKDMAEHEENDKLHLHLAIDATLQMQKALLKAINATQELKRELHVMAKKQHLQDTVAFKVTGYGKYKKENQKFTSPPFYSSPHGYYLAIKVHVNGLGTGKGTHVSVFASVLEGRYDAGLNWPLIGDITIMLLNQLQNKNHHFMTFSLSTSDNIRVGNSWGLDEFIPHSLLSYNPAKNTQYLKDNALYFRVSVEVDDHKPWLECNVL